MGKLNSSEYIAFNSYGGFGASGREYHILNTNTPLPWCNIMANESFGTIISSYGTVYSYFKNSQGFKISNWCNDWITFKPGEIFKGIFEKNYNLTYGFGYTILNEEDADFEKKMDIFIPTDENVKIQYIKILNKSSREKSLNIKYYIDPVLGVTNEVTLTHIISKVQDNILYMKNPYSVEFPDYMAFLTALKSSEDSNTNITILDNYGVDVNITLKPQEETIFAIILGAMEDEKYASEVVSKYSDFANIENDYAKTKKYWENKVVKKFDTKDKYLDILAGGWLLYQTIVCRLFARSGFYQSGGALGYRDQLQDTLSLISSWPDKTRSQIILHSSKQFEKGDVLHWWHNHNNSGIRTHFSDDYLWLPYVLCEYIEKTNDTSVLDVMTPFLEDKDMGDRKEVYDVYNKIDKEASVYEHAKKSIKYGLSRVSSKNGLLDIGDGDWNDGFSNIRGQSVWLTFFMMNILDKFVNIAKIKKDNEMVKICEKKRHLLKHAVIENAWDDDHFVRAFFENGDVLGANSNNECKIDLISQAWAVIAMKNDPDVQNELETSIKTTEKYLVDKENGIVKLLYPAFDKPENDPGYIKAYVPGTRENGGQYTHAATWLAKAYFDLGDYKKGIEILHMICPISHSDTKEKADKYMVEPYVVAADIYSNPDHVGRGGWTWYTGSSSWMYKIIEDYLKK